MAKVEIVLWRDRVIGNWCATFKGDDIKNDSTHTLGYSVAEEAGDVAEAVARNNPGTRIGVKSTEYGPRTVALYGPVVWLKLGFRGD
jgi:hypothetical protein